MTTCSNAHSGAEQALHAKGSPSAKQEVLAGGDQNTNTNTEHIMQNKKRKIQNTNIFIKSSTSDKKIFCSFSKIKTTKKTIKNER